MVKHLEGDSYRCRVPDRDQADAYASLADTAQSSIGHRKVSEWTVAIAYWTLIVVFTWFLLQKDSTVKITEFVAGGVTLAYICALAIWVFLWQIPVTQAHEIDRQFKHYYMDLAEGRFAQLNQSYVKRLKGWWYVPCDCRWVTGQISMTALIMVASAVLIWNQVEYKYRVTSTKRRGGELAAHRDLLGEMGGFVGFSLIDIKRLSQSRTDGRQETKAP